MAKMGLPKPIKTIRRFRIEKLLENVKCRKVTIVTGAPGIGKTTCVINFLNIKDFPFIYHSFKQDSDLIIDLFVTLSSYMKSQSIQKQFQILEGLSNESYAGKLIELLQHLESEKDFFIVIDDYLVDNVQNNFHDFLQLLINNSMPNIHFIIITMKKLPWNKLHNTIYSRIFEITNYQMLFTYDETVCFYKEGYDFNLNDEQVKLLYNFTGGWAVAMALIGHKIKFEPDYILDLHKRSINAIRRLPDLSAYIEYKFLVELTKDQRYVLYATSIVEEFNEELALRLIGDDKIELLDMLCNEYTIISCIMVNPQIYKYNKLWQSVIYNKAYRVLGANKMSQLNQISGDYFYEKELFKKAMFHYIQGENLEKIVALLEQVGAEILDDNLAIKFYSLFNKNPNNKLKDNPWIQYGYACSMRYKDPELCYYYLDYALEGFRKIGNDKGILRILFIKTQTLMFYTGGLYKMTDLINDQELYSVPEKVSDLRIIAYKQVYAGYSHCYLTGNLQEAVKLGEQARRTGLLIQDNSLVIWSCWVLGVALSYQGRISLAKAYITEALEKLNSENIDQALIMLVPYVAGFNATVAGDFKTAKAYLELATNKSKELGLVAFNYYIMNYSSNVAVYMGDFHDGEHYLDEMKDSVMKYLKEDNYHARSFLLAAQAHHAFLIGKNSKALNYAIQSLELRKKSGGETFFIRCHLILGAVYRELSYYQESEAEIEKALEKSIKVNSSYYEASCYIQLSLIYAESGNKEGFKKFVEKAMHLAMDNSFYHFFMWKDENIVKLLNMMGYPLIFRDYIDDLIEYRNLSIDKPKDLVKSIPTNSPVKSIQSKEEEKPLKIYMMGPFIIKLNGIPIKDHGSQKALYLLKMLCTTNEGISVQKLIDEMWSDWEKDLAMNNFYYTLHKLRKILKDKGSVIFKDGLCRLNNDLYWTDVGEFSCLKIKSKELMKNSSEEEAIQFMNRATSLYRGEFLEGENLGEILSGEREYIERNYYEILLDQAKILVKLKKFDKAIQVIEKARLSSYFDENAYRILMIAHYSQGNLKHAIDIYYTLKDDLYRELGASPNHLTTKLYEFIIKGDELKDISKWLF